MCTHSLLEANFVRLVYDKLNDIRKVQLTPTKRRDSTLGKIVKELAQIDVGLFKDLRENEGVK